eukprot:6467871-Pyramimonas_sp.AAC.1
MAWWGGARRSMQDGIPLCVASLLRRGLESKTGGCAQLQCDADDIDVSASVSALRSGRLERVQHSGPG